MKNEDRRDKRKPYKEKEQRNKAVFLFAPFIFNCPLFFSFLCFFFPSLLSLSLLPFLPASLSLCLCSSLLFFSSCQLYLNYISLPFVLSFFSLHFLFHTLLYFLASSFSPFLFVFLFLSRFLFLILLTVPQINLFCSLF